MKHVYRHLASLLILAVLMVILNKVWKMTLMKSIHEANEVKGKRSARLFKGGLQKMMRVLMDRFRDIKVYI